MPEHADFLQAFVWSPLWLKVEKSPCSWWLNPHSFSTSYPLVSWQNYTTSTSPFLNLIGTSSINGNLMGIFDSYLPFYRVPVPSISRIFLKIFQRIHGWIPSNSAIRPRPGHIFWRGPGWSLPLRPRTSENFDLKKNRLFSITEKSTKNQTEQ